MSEPGRRDLERDLEDYEDALEREYRDYEAHLARVYEREGAVGRRSAESSEGGADEGDSSLVDDFIDRLIPEHVDWRKLVRDHPWPAVGLAAIGGYFLARSRGSAVIAALSGFAANAVADGVNEALGEDIL
ncbi:MAG: hypothetical protein ABI609_06290 [Acidobacteriota bacterium]